jgi:hypothetical protein
MKHWLILVLCLVVTSFSFGQNQGGEDCSTAVDLGTLGGPDSCPGGAGFSGEDMETAAVSTMNPSCDEIGNNYDLWYSFEAPASGGVQIELELGTAVRIEAAVWSDCSTEVWCSSSNVDGAMIMGLTPGETYLLQLWSDAFARGTFDFCVFAKDDPPTNDFCDDPIAITITQGQDPCSIGGGGGSYFSNIGASSSGIQPFPSCGNFGMGMDVWHEIIVPASGTVNLEITSAIGPQDWAMNVYSGDCNTLTEIACDDDSGDQLFPKIDLSGRTPGERLLIRVWEIGGDNFGRYQLIGYEPDNTPPTNDICASAIDLTPLIDPSGTCNPICGHNVNATASGESPLPSCGSFGSGNDVWYQVTVPQEGGVTVEMRQFSDVGPADWALAAYAGPCGGLTEIACDDDSGPGLFPRIELTGRTPGEVIYFRVWEFQANEVGAFNICATPPAPLAVQDLELSIKRSNDVNEVSWTYIGHNMEGKYVLEYSEPEQAWITINEGQIQGTRAQYNHIAKAEEMKYRVNLYDLQGDMIMSVEDKVMEDLDAISWKIVPVPAGDFVILKGLENGPDDRLSILDMSGKEVLLPNMSDSQGQELRVDISILVPGVYMVRWENRGKVEARSFIKK